MKKLYREIARRRMWFWLRVNHVAWPIEGERWYRVRSVHGWLDPLFVLSARRHERAIEDYLKVAAQLRNS